MASRSACGRLRHQPGTEGLVDVPVHELPADLLESGDRVAVDDVDTLGALLADEGGSLAGALAPAHK
jgi:hypothetical protein